MSEAKSEADLSVPGIGETVEGARVSAIQITVSPHDPMIVRDGRPFGAGGEGDNRARSLDWPYPSTTAGAVRTLIGRLAAGSGIIKAGTANPFHEPSFLERLKRTTVWGPLPMVADNLYFPAPFDILAFGNDEWIGLRPAELGEGEGCDLPNRALLPVHIPRREKSRPDVPAFWSSEAMTKWLSVDAQRGFVPGPGMGQLLKDERVHVRIDPCSSTADDGQLFLTQEVIVPDVDVAGPPAVRTTRLAVLVQPSDAELAVAASQVRTLHPFGGERRLAHFAAQPPHQSWRCPNSIREGLADCAGLRMVLATPAIFKTGWLPRWMERETLEGSPPGMARVRLRLRGACMGRWRPVSGWSLERGRVGPKPIRRVVPSGSVYFFEVLSGSARDLTSLWLHPVSDEGPERDDGFGLAMWGAWDPKTTKGGFPG